MNPGTCPSAGVQPLPESALISWQGSQDVAEDSFSTFILTLVLPGVATAILPRLEPPKVSKACPLRLPVGTFTNLLSHSDI